MALPRDLPPGAMAWAREMQRMADEVKHLTTVVQTMTNQSGMDYRNPTRGISSGAAPSVQNPLTLKLNALNDMEVRNAQDGDYIMWSALKNKWVVGRPETSVLSERIIETNVILDPSFENGMAGWSNETSHAEDPALGPWFITNVVQSLEWVEGGRLGGHCLKVTLGLGVDPAPGPGANTFSYNWISLGRKPIDTLGNSIYVGADTAEIVGIASRCVFFAADGTWLGMTTRQFTTISGTGLTWAKLAWSTAGATPDYPTATHYELYVDLSETYEDWKDGMVIYIDDYARTPSGSNFSGLTATDTQWMYQWAGTPNGAPSNQIVLGQIEVPVLITRGVLFNVKGTGFIEGVPVTLSAFNDPDPTDYYSQEVTPGPGGTFLAIMTVPVNVDPEYGVFPGAGRISFDFEVAGKWASSFATVVFK